MCAVWVFCVDKRTVCLQSVLYINVYASTEIIPGRSDLMDCSFHSHGQNHTTILIKMKLSQNQTDLNLIRLADSTGGNNHKIFFIILECRCWIQNQFFILFPHKPRHIMIHIHRYMHLHGSTCMHNTHMLLSGWVLRLCPPLRLKLPG